MVLVYPKIVSSMSEDASFLDESVILSDPPEFVLPEWDRDDEVPPWETHDYTSDYDYPYEYSPDHDEEFE